MSNDITKLFASLAKSYGENSIYRLPDVPDCDVVSTGSLSLDFALGIGGLPLRRVVEIGGENGAGKTVTSLHIANNYLNAYPDKIVAFLDLEHRLEKEWASHFIDDMDRVLVLKPESAEEGLNMYRDLAHSDRMSLAIWDSIGGSPTSAELEKDTNKQQFGGNSRIITTFAKFAPALSDKHNFTTLALNQVRQDMSGYKRYLTPGGEGWKHSCSIRIQLKIASKSADGEKTESINGEEMLVGRKILAKLVKSSVSPAGRVASWWFYNQPNENGFGIDRVEEVARLSSLTGVVEKSGAWMKHDSFPDGKVHGLARFSQFLRENPKIKDLLYKQTMAKMQSGSVDMSEIVPMSSDPEESLEDNLQTRVALSMADIAAKARE